MNPTGLSLKTVLALCFGLISAVLTVCLTLLIGHYASQHDKSTAKARLDELADAAVIQLDRGMHQRMHDVVGLARLQQLRENISPDLNRRLLEGLQSAVPDYAWLGVSNLEGLITYASSHVQEGADVSQQRWFVEGRERLYLGDVHADNMTAPDQTPVIDIALPLRSPGGESIGVLGAQVSWAWARRLENQLLTPARRAEDLQIFVVSADGRVLLAPSGWRDSGLPRNIAPTQAQETDWPDGRRYLTSQRRSQGLDDYPGLGWTVIARQPAAQAFAAVNRLQHYILLAGLALAAGFALLGLGLAHVLSRPLARLAQGADRLRLGETQQLPPAGGFRESRQLSQSFTALLDSLQTREAELATLNASLENQVRDRTLAIEKANQHLMGVLEERLQLQRQLEEQAATDSLTGLLNRRAFDQRANLELSRVERGGQGFSLITFDIDHFKRVNDSFGHDRGDEVLKACAAICGKELRDTDICARFGGEEFVLLLPDTNTDGARQLAERLRERMATCTVESPQGPIRFSASFGIAPHVRGQALALSLQQADQALYAAKNSGRNRVVVFF